MSTYVPLTYDQAVAKGKKLQAAMLNGDSPESQFLDHQQLKQDSYTRSTVAGLTPFPLIHQIIAERGQGSHKLPVNVTYHHESISDDESTFNNEPYIRSFASFTNIVDRPNGFLIATESYKDRRLAEYAELRHWSDFAYLAWTEPAADEEKRRGDLKYVLRWTIANYNTVQVASKILASYRAERGISDEVWRPPWPGISFDADTERAHALLGTPNGSGVAWLLMQHKPQLGHKVVQKVTLFYTFKMVGTELRQCQPNLLFCIGNVGE